MHRKEIKKPCFGTKIVKNDFYLLFEDVIYHNTPSVVCENCKSNAHEMAYSSVVPRIPIFTSIPFRRAHFLAIDCIFVKQAKIALKLLV